MRNKLGLFVHTYVLTNSGLSTNNSCNHNTQLATSSKNRKKHHHNGPPKLLASSGSKIRGEYNRHTFRNDGRLLQHGNAILLSETDKFFTVLTIIRRAAAQRAC